MGYMKHDAIVVTTWKGEAIESAALTARDMGLVVIGPSKEGMNGYRTLLVCPDGSKEGWPESDQFDDRRTKFIEYLESTKYEDGSSLLEWVAVSYGSDDEGARIESHAWEANDVQGQ